MANSKIANTFFKTEKWNTIVYIFIEIEIFKIQRNGKLCEWSNI